MVQRKGAALSIPPGHSPSASIHKGRFHCFTCNLSLDVFAFVSRAQRTDFKRALAYLAHRYGVPLNNRVLTDAEKREYAETERIRCDAPYFGDAERLVVEWALEELPPKDRERAVYTALLVVLRVSPEAVYRAWL